MIFGMSWVIEPVKALLDINVLIALFDEDHTHHAAASEWLEDNIVYGWASCPLTQNGCIRIMSQPRYPNAVYVTEIVARLKKAVSTKHHSFIPDNISLLNSDIIQQERLLSPRQLTDIYLLALAVENECRFITFDRTIPIGTVKRATAASLTVI